MDCTQSMIDNEQSLVRCKGRKNLQKNATVARNDVAGGHTGADQSDSGQGESHVDQELHQQPPPLPIFTSSPTLKHDHEIDSVAISEEDQANSKANKHNGGEGLKKQAEVVPIKSDRVIESADDIIFEIFSWLPAKSLCTFKCCSKSILELTKQKKFALKQSQNSLRRNDSYFFIQQRTFPDLNNGKTEIHALYGEKASSCGVPTSFMYFLNELISIRILASDNGLLLCRTLNKIPLKLYVFNPATSSCNHIPIPPHFEEHVPSFFVCALECNSENYRLFLFENDIGQRSSLRCRVYVPKENVWKARDRRFNFVQGRELRFDSPVFHKGALHFVSHWSPHFGTNSAYSLPYIASYNLESGISGMIRVPEESIENDVKYGSDVGIFKWENFGSSNESICLVRLAYRTVFTIWVLANYESNCWSRLLTISLKEMGLGKKDDYEVRGFIVMNGESLVFGAGKNVYRYDLVGEKRGSLEKICEHRFEHCLIHFTSYSSTLRPCRLAP